MSFWHVVYQSIDISKFLIYAAMLGAILFSIFSCMFYLTTEQDWFAEAELREKAQMREQ